MELLPRPRVTSQDVTAHTVPALLCHIKQDAERGSVLLGEWGGPAQEAYLGQPRTMGSWRVYLFCILLCATGQFYSYAQIQTEEYKTKYLPYFSTAEDSNEKQLVSCTSCLKSCWPECLMNCLFQITANIYCVRITFIIIQVVQFLISRSTTYTMFWKGFKTITFQLLEKSMAICRW